MALWRWELTPGQPAGGEPGPGTAAEGSSTFPDLPRLELDQLLGQLVERAQEVLATQGRLRGLLQATQVVTGDLGLPVVLQRIVATARDLVGARYAALGVIARTGGWPSSCTWACPTRRSRRSDTCHTGRACWQR